MQSPDSLYSMSPDLIGEGFFDCSTLVLNTNTSSTDVLSTSTSASTSGYSTPYQSAPPSPCATNDGGKKKTETNEAGRSMGNSYMTPEEFVAFFKAANSLGQAVKSIIKAYPGYKDVSIYARARRFGLHYDESGQLHQDTSDEAYEAVRKRRGRGRPRLSQAERQKRGRSRHSKEKAVEKVANPKGPSQSSLTLGQSVVDGAMQFLPQEGSGTLFSLEPLQQSQLNMLTDGLMMTGPEFGTPQYPYGAGGSPNSINIEPNSPSFEFPLRSPDRWITGRSLSPIRPFVIGGEGLSTLPHQWEL